MGRHQKYLIKLILSFSLIFSPILVWAGAAEKWEIVEKVYDATSQNVEITARKIGATAANDPIYKTRVPVAAAELGSAARAGIFGVAVAVGVQGMLEALGWLMDPATQSIYRNKKNPDQPLPDDQYDYQVPTITTPQKTYGGQYVRNASSVASIYQGFSGIVADNANTKYIILNAYVFMKNGRPNLHLITEYENSNGSRYNHSERDVELNRRISQLPDSPPPEKEYLSDEDLGKEILGQGENTSPMPSVITDIYDPNSPIDSVPKTKTADALDSANPQPSTDPTGESKPKPNVDTDGDGVPDSYDSAQPDAGQDFTLPPACDWFPAACDFFFVQKQDNKEIKKNQKEQLEQDKTFFEKVGEFFDWFKDDPSNDNELDIEQSNEQEPNTTISFSTSCPAKIPLQFNWNGQSLDFSFDFTIWCQAISTFVYPIVVTLGSLHALYIVTGVRQDG